jgi:urease accessory protein
MRNLVRFTVLVAAFATISTGASAHVGVGDTSSLVAGFRHPLGGLDHLTVMVAVGLWAALKGGRALWVWPAAFVGVMLAGGALGMLQVAVPFVEPGILASVVTLGLLVAFAADLPVGAGAAIIGLFALFHGHAHGTEVPETGGGIAYLAGFALATAALHGTGIAAGIILGRRYRALTRAAGLAVVGIGAALYAGAL